MPEGERFGGGGVIQGEEVCSAGALRIMDMKWGEWDDIGEIRQTRDGRIASTKRWATQQIEKIMDAREPLLIIICVHDEKLCDICREECGRIGYGRTDFMEGPPFHYGCRCYLEETGGYGTYLFEGKNVTEEELSKLEWIREEEAYRISHWVAMAKMQIEDVQKETQEFIDNYIANCRVFVGWFRVDCIKKMGYACEGEQGTEKTLYEKGCMPPYANSTCWAEYIGYEVIEICTGE